MSYVKFFLSTPTTNKVINKGEKDSRAAKMTSDGSQETGEAHQLYKGHWKSFKG